jgi:hypothetical protein
MATGTVPGPGDHRAVTILAIEVTGGADEIAPPAQSRAATAAGTAATSRCRARAQRPGRGCGPVVVDAVVRAGVWAHTGSAARGEAEGGRYGRHRGRRRRIGPRGRRCGSPSRSPDAAAALCWSSRCGSCPSSPKTWAPRPPRCCTSRHDSAPHRYSMHRSTRPSTASPGRRTCRWSCAAGIQPRSPSPLGRTGDLLVVGARGRGGFRHLLTGSITTQLVNHAPCLVTVVPSRRAEARG